jgi:hypothetical protein
MPSDMDDYLVNRLSQAANQDDLILELCYRTGMNWTEAAGYLQRLEAMHNRRIRARLIPYLFILSLGAFIAGVSMGLAYYLEISASVHAMLGRSASLAQIFRFAVLTAYNLPLLIGGITLAAAGATGMIAILLRRELTF